MPVEALIFDFDGVVADSEGIASAVAAELATAAGLPLTAAQALDLFVGKRAVEVRQMVEARTNRSLPEFEDALLANTIAAFERGLQPVPGVVDFLDRHPDLQRCIASSSPHVRLAASLERIGLAEAFAGRVFSADDVARGKPFPDLFLWAARALHVDPCAALVIEDSVAGITAARNAGMRSIGLVAGSHAGPVLAERLRDAGANRVARDYAEVDRILAEWT